jgi:hypothetical protein
MLWSAEPLDRIFADGREARAIVGEIETDLADVVEARFQADL